MHSLIDVLITEYRAEDHTTRVVERIAQANDRLGHTFNRLLALIAAFNVAQKTLDFVGNAQKAASEYQSLEARLSALVGTVEDARRKLGMAELVAAPSPFTTKQLANAAVTLEAFGLNSERLLPILGKLGAAMGATDEKLEVFTRGFGKLGQGEMIDSDVLSAMGITKADFAAQGIEFDGQGKLLSSAEKSMAALEAIVETRFGGILEKMASTPEAKRASLEDAGERALRIIGMGILKTQGPLVDALTKNLNAAIDSGVLAEVVGKASNEVFAALNLGGQGDAVTGIMARVLAFVEVVPGNIAKGIAFLRDFTGAAVNNVVEFFRMVEDRVDQFAARLTLMMGQAQVVTQAIADAIAAPAWQAGGILSRAINNAMTMGQVGEAAIGIGGQYNPAYRALPKAPDFQGVNPSRVGEIEARIREAMSRTQASIPDTSGMSFFSRMASPSPEAKALEEIADNTREIADKTVNISELIFGGRERASKGIALIDVFGSATRRGDSSSRAEEPRTVRFEVGPAATELERALTTFMMDNMPQILRLQGVGGV